jgi:hypothetical protein
MAMTDRPAIVVIAFSRPRSLRRLLDSLQSANYGSKEEISMIISIDHGYDPEVLRMAEDFEWEHGEKQVSVKNRHYGLKSHILHCGNLTNTYGSIIMLEDDLVVSPDFYHFALNAISFYKDDPKIAGISLYSYHYSETARLPFCPLDDAYDNYFMQVPSSWGQIWTHEQWNGFMNAGPQELEHAKVDQLPEAVQNWSAHSWKKLFFKYLLLSSKFIVYPRDSFTTNFSDIGSNSKFPQTRYQVPLVRRGTIDYHFSKQEESGAVYDGYFELIINENNAGLLPDFLDSDVIVDTYGTKDHLSDKAYCLSSRPCKYPEKQWDLAMVPPINNVIFGIDGKVLSLAKAEHFTEMTRKQRKTVERKLLEIGFIYGEDSIRHDFRYQIGKILSYPALIFYRALKLLR